jgi:hypothetical protein
LIHQSHYPVLPEEKRSANVRGPFKVENSIINFEKPPQKRSRFDRRSVKPYLAVLANIHGKRGGIADTDKGGQSKCEKNIQTVFAADSTPREKQTFIFYK